MSIIIYFYTPIHAHIFTLGFILCASNISILSYDYYKFIYYCLFHPKLSENFQTSLRFMIARQGFFRGRRKALGNVCHYAHVNTLPFTMSKVTKFIITWALFILFLFLLFCVSTLFIRSTVLLLRP